MRRKRIIGIAAIVILIITIVIIISKDYRRTNEEYIAVFTENRDNFEYVTQIMKL